MGAIDKNDQLKKTYAIDRKLRKWWMRISFHLLDICRLNSFIVYQQCYLRWNSGPVEEDVAPMTKRNLPLLLSNLFVEQAPRVNIWAALRYLQIPYLYVH